MEETLTPEEQKLKNDFPSLELVYEIAIKSYEAMAKKFEAIDSRIQTMTAFAVTASFALPAVGKAQNIPFFSVWLAIGLGLILLAIIVAVYARLTGEMWMLDPAKLHKGSLHLSKSKFQLYAIYYAAEDYKKNIDEVNRKWTLSVISMALFALAILSLSIWLLLSQPILANPPQT